MTGRPILAVVLLLAAFLLPAVSGQAQDVPVPDGYRMSHYRAPVPDHVPGAETVGTEQIARLVDQGAAVLIDVMPAPPRPEGREDWQLPRRRSLPGARWLPNVGFGPISDTADHYFRRHLAQLLEDRKGGAVVIFCERGCWMSWNAAKRAGEYGYTNIYWYPDGTDGWREAGRPLVELEPEGDGPPR